MEVVMPFMTSSQKSHVTSTSSYIIGQSLGQVQLTLKEEGLLLHVWKGDLPKHL